MANLSVVKLPSEEEGSGTIRVFEVKTGSKCELWPVRADQLSKLGVSRSAAADRLTYFNVKY